MDELFLSQSHVCSHCAYIFGAAGKRSENPHFDMKKKKKKKKKRKKTLLPNDTYMSSVRLPFLGCARLPTRFSERLRNISQAARQIRRAYS